MFACKMQIFSYFENIYLSIFGFAYLCILLNIYAYGLVFWHIRAFLASKANQFNKYSAATGARRERSFFRLLSLLLFLCFNRPLTPLKVPKVDELVLGKVVASEFGQWKVPLQQQGEPGFLMPLVLHVLAKSLFLPRRCNDAQCP